MRNDLEIIEAIKVLHESGVRTNLDLLEKGITAAGRRSLVSASGLPAEVISDLVNRADFSRMPWASKATISNFIGAGYTSWQTPILISFTKISSVMDGRLEKT